MDVWIDVWADRSVLTVDVSAVNTYLRSSTGISIHTVRPSNPCSYGNLRPYPPKSWLRPAKWHRGRKRRWRHSIVMRLVPSCCSYIYILYICYLLCSKTYVILSKTSFSHIHNTKQKKANPSAPPPMQPTSSTMLGTATGNPPTWASRLRTRAQSGESITPGKPCCPRKSIATGKLPGGKISLAQNHFLPGVMAGVKKRKSSITRKCKRPGAGYFCKSW